MVQGRRGVLQILAQRGAESINLRNKWNPIRCKCKQAFRQTDSPQAEGAHFCPLSSCDDVLSPKLLLVLAPNLRKQTPKANDLLFRSALSEFGCRLAHMRHRSMIYTHRPRAAANLTLPFPSSGSLLPPPSCGTKAAAKLEGRGPLFANSSTDRLTLTLYQLACQSFSSRIFLDS